MLNIILILISVFCFFKICSLFWILLLLNGFMFLWHFFIMRYRFRFSDKAMYMFFGLPGSGKSTVCADIVRQGNTKKSLFNIGFFCNFPVSGAFKISRDEIGSYDLRTSDKPKSVLLLDEASTVYFKRNAVSKDPKKQFKDSENEFHSMHRHYQCMEIFFAQSWDGVDLRLRELSTRLYYVEHSRFKNFIKIREISKIFAIDENHQPIDGYDFVKFSSRYVWAPACWKLFDSYTCPGLPSRDWQVWESFPEKKNHQKYPFKFLGKIRHPLYVRDQGERGPGLPPDQDPKV